MTPLSMNATKICLLLQLLGAALAFSLQEIKLPDSGTANSVVLNNESLHLANGNPASPREQELKLLALDFEKYSKAGDINGFSNLYETTARTQLAEIGNDPAMYDRWMSAAKETKKARLIGWMEGSDSTVQVAFILENEGSEGQTVMPVGIALEEGKLKFGGLAMDAGSNRFKSWEWWSKNGDKTPEIILKNQGSHLPTAPTRPWIFWVIAGCVFVGLLLIFIWKKLRK
jgi:hypothetical protein